MKSPVVMIEFSLTPEQFEEKIGDLTALVDKAARVVRSEDQSVNPKTRYDCARFIQLLQSTYAKIDNYILQQPGLIDDVNKLVQLYKDDAEEEADVVEPFIYDE